MTDYKDAESYCSLARQHADEMEDLYRAYRAQAEALADTCEKLLKASAAAPYHAKRVTELGGAGQVIRYYRHYPVDPEEGLDWLHRIMSAVYADCWAENASTYDLGVMESTRETLAEMRSGR